MTGEWGAGTTSGEDLELQEDWQQDGATVAALFSPLRPRQVNPEGYDAQVSFWRRRLSTSCLQRGSVFVRAEQLRREWTIGEWWPQCIEQVLQLMYSEGDVMTRSEFESLSTECPHDPSWTSWLLDILVWRIPQTAWRFLKSSFTPSVVQQDLVDLKALQILSERVYKHLAPASSIINNIYDSDICVVVVDRLFEQCKSLLNSRADFDAILCHLCRTGRAKMCNLPTPYLSADSDVLCVVKLRPLTSTQVPLISDTDKVYVQLSECERVLKDEIGRAEKRCEEHKRAAIEYLKQTSRSQALRSMKQRRYLQSVIDQRCTTLDKIDQMRHSMAQSKNNHQVLEAMSCAALLLKQLSGHSSSNGRQSVLGVHKVMNNVAESLEEHAHVTSLISGPSDLSTDSVSQLSSGDVSTAELEHELTELLRESSDDGDSKNVPHDQDRDLMSRLPALDDLPSLESAESSSRKQRSEQACTG